MQNGSTVGTRGSDRLLWAIVAGAIVLVVAGFGVLFAVQDRMPAQYPEDTPQGVVQSYLKAVSEGRYEDAEGYIAESVKNRYPERFPKPHPVRPSPSEQSHRVVLQDAKISGDTATVTVAVSQYSGGGGLFGGGSDYTNTYVFGLRREGGAWRITSPDYPIFF